MTQRAVQYAAAMAGLVFVGCSLLNAVPASPAPRRREVVVKGRRIKTIDIHAHCAVPAAMALAGRDPGRMSGNYAGARLLLSSLPERLATMDAQGIDVEALSITPYWQHTDRDTAAEIVRLQNEA